jgi:CheY-like chemotaxis protein
MSARPPLILVVEDNLANLLLVRSVLRLAEMTVVEAVTAAAARQLVRETTPDLVLMDVRLPDGDGLQLTRELKASPATASIPVLVLTAHAMKGDAEAAAAAGCDGFITKPIDTRTLAQEVRRHMALALRTPKDVAGRT